MGSATPVQQQITQYLPRLNAEQQKAVLTVVKTFVKQQEVQYTSPLKEASFVAEMDRRMAELESGKVEGNSWEDVKRKARKAVKASK